MSRLFPALDVFPSSSADAEVEERQGAVLAALDDSSVTAVQELPAGWRIFFTSAAHRDAAMEVLRRAWLDGLGVAPVDVADEDWARRSQENLGPVRIGQVRISPPWALPSRAGTADPGGLIDIVIQPSMGFGTGHHASTRLSVALLQQVDVVGKRVLDVGTGSGVLAILASRLGADAVLGIDNDADALDCARENLQLNDATSAIEVRLADFRGLSRLQFDVVIANLTGALLVRGASSLLATLAPDASLLLSGITVEEESSVRATFEPGLSLGARLDEDGWVGLRYQRVNAR